MATDVLAPPVEERGPAEGSPPRSTGQLMRPGRLEVVLAVLGFAALCVLVLTKASRMLEPDDYAYQASIVALSQGHVVLTTAQYHALSHQLGDGGVSIPQWVHLSGGGWISQKNPGYPFAVVLFQVLGILRVAPLAYAALACTALFVGARRWLGRYGGTAAVLLFCTSGAALTFAWRATMSSFVGAALVATGAGLLLWTLLAHDASRRQRLLGGVAAFAALEAATAIRYTNVIELGIAVAVVLVAARRCAVPWRTVGWWLATVAVFAGALLAFDAVVYGGPFQTGYRAGLITFSLSALVPNLAHMPGRLLVAMPMIVLALVAAVWIAGRVLLDALTGEPLDVGHRRDAAVAGALVAGWVAMWGLYLTYTWTVDQFGDPVHVVRFYLPAVGLVALLGAWLLVRAPAVAALGAVAALLVLGIVSFHGMAASSAVPVGGAGGPGVVGPRGRGFGPGGPGPGDARPGGARPGRTPGFSRLPPGAA